MSVAAEKLKSAEAAVSIPKERAEKLFKDLTAATRAALMANVEIYPVPEGREPAYEIISYDSDGQLVLPGKVAEPGTQRLVIH